MRIVGQFLEQQRSD